MGSLDDVPFKYDFHLENWVLNGLCSHSNERISALPSCPPYWLLFSSPQERRSLHLCKRGLCEQGQRQRSLSLSSADLQRCHLPRKHLFLVDNSTHEAAGYSEDDEGSSAEEDQRYRSQSKERTKFSLQQEAQKPRSPRAHIHPHSNSSSSQKEMCSPPSLRLSRPHKKHSCGSSSGKRNIVTRKPHTTHTKLQLRPSSAGPQPSAHKHKSSPQKERELVENITAHGYTLRSAILALQRTGTHSAEQILEYLLARDRLCALGYEKTQVEDALEMFQNCERKASEFLRLLAQFCEMGFQQSTIKEVLLLHNNHRERALEELVTHVT
ncbi:Ubiquitin-associated protein 1-like [Bagarius yarrelli]|uniref:Ubiquitin-associated protein 1-like n=1 Tax=Bagarius yarrelli TaxID=175774 RepID=A0A556TI55_BAGYA|nr:Ubiquitin-associated protein 1-like [Bagarius yarrelli]